MIDKSSFNILNFVKKEDYSGSMDGMRYMIGKCKGEKEEDPDRIKVTIWPEPFGIAATPDENKTVAFFTLDPDGISDTADWLNKQYFDRQDEWKAAAERGCSKT